MVTNACRKGCDIIRDIQNIVLKTFRDFVYQINYYIKNPFSCYNGLLLLYIATLIRKEYFLSKANLIIEEVNKVLFDDKPAKEGVKDLMVSEKREEHLNLKFVFCFVFFFFFFF